MYFDVPEGWNSYLQGHLQPAWLAVSTDWPPKWDRVVVELSLGHWILPMERRCITDNSRVDTTQYQSTILLHQSLKFYSCFQFYLHPGRLTWNLQITHLERKMIFQTSMIIVPCQSSGVFFAKIHQFSLRQNRSNQEEAPVAAPVQVLPPETLLAAGRFKGFSSCPSGWGRRSWSLDGPCHGGHARSGHARSGGSNAWGGRGSGSYDARWGSFWFEETWENTWKIAHRRLEWPQHVPTGVISVLWVFILG